MNLEQSRFNMIEQQIRPWDVLDSSVLELLSIVRRENFVPAAHRSMAFFDMEVPLGYGQCMLAPRLEARLLQDLAVQKHEKVLEVGTGSGFVAALLGHKAQQVISLELHPELVSLARSNLQQASILNVDVRQANAADESVIAGGPFDAIMLSGSVASAPQHLLNQLKIGGRLIAVIGSEPMMRAQLLTRINEREFSSKVLFDTNAPRLEGFAEPTRFKF